MHDQAVFKQQAAYRAVEYVELGMVVGLGTGSTVQYTIERIAALLKDGHLQDIRGIPSSIHTEKLARTLGIPLTTFDEHPTIDITIDGADEVDPHLNLIKGGGGALVREKILAQASRRNIIVVDESKLSPRLGTHRPVPVEVLPFARPVEEQYLQALGATVVWRTTRHGDPFTTDQENFILDCHFGPIARPEYLARQLNERAGIVGHGLFVGIASEVLVAGPAGVRHLVGEPPMDQPHERSTA